MPTRRDRGARGWLVSVGVLLAATGLNLGGVQPVRAETDPQASRLTRILARGEAQLERRQRRAAEGSFARALRLEPLSVRGVSGLQRALLPPIEAQSAEVHASEARAAERVLAALDAFPEGQRREELQLVEATALVALARQREALDVLAHAPRIPTATLLPVLDALAMLSAERGDLPCAEDALRLALELDLTIPRALRLADVHLARGEARRAVPVLLTALRVEPESIPLHLAITRAQLAAGDTNGAEATLARVSARCPRQCGLLRARVALEAGRPEQAAQIARGLLSLTPDAAESATAGLTDAPDHRSEAGYLLGLALARNGQPDEAREVLSAALRRDPTHRGAQQALRALATAAP